MNIIKVLNLVYIKATIEKLIKYDKRNKSNKKHLVYTKVQD